MATGKLFKGYSTTHASTTSQTRLYDIDLIKQDLLNHFSIKRGEKLENPNFGTTIPWMLFEPFSETIQKAIEDDVVRIFSYDPRVRLNVVEVTKDESRQSIIVRCDVTFIPFDTTGGVSWEFGQNGTIQMLTQ